MSGLWFHVSRYLLCHGSLRRLHGCTGDAAVEDAGGAQAALLAVLCLIYVISPIDFAPAAVLGPFGAVDDMGCGLCRCQIASQGDSQV